MTRPPKFEISAAEYRGEASEAQWRRTVNEALGHYGWEVLLELPDAGLGKLTALANGSPKKGVPTHRPMRWLLPFLAAVSGWPDLTVGNRRQGRMLFLELKTKDGRVRANQAATIELLRACGQTVYVLRPTDDRDLLDSILSGC